MNRRQTGLRSKEPKTLTISKCKLDEEIPVLIVKAGYSKHRRDDTQPITPELAELLGQYFRGRDVADLLFPRMPTVNRVAKMLKVDLNAARIPYRDQDGRVLDFHALRVTLGSNPSLAGVPVKLAMDLLRHGDPRLTLATYSNTFLPQRADAVRNLPSLTDAFNTAESAKSLNQQGLVSIE